MDDLRRRFATLDAVPPKVHWAEIEQRTAVPRIPKCAQQSLDGFAA